jgi:heme exporter protein A
MLLKLEKIAKFYGTRLVIKDVSLSVTSGSITLLAGANGAGKSTLLRIMAGLARPSAGKVLCHAAEDKIGYLGHQTFIYPDLSALENLSFWAGLHGQRTDEQALLDILDRVELKRFAFERAGSFSRGMAQRLNLARIFLLQPDLILLDEPGTGLDVRSMSMLRREIEEARNRGAGLVWISHSVAEDLALADAVVAIGDRRVLYNGPAAGYIPEAAC